MKKSLRKRRFLCALCACLLLLSGCGSAPESAAQSAPIVLPAPTAEPQPMAGGEIWAPMPTNARINEPYLVNTEEMLGFYSLIYEPLIRLDSAGRIFAGLAENWSCDDTGRVWEFRLRAARWHGSGEKLTAADVVYSYAQIKSLGSRSYYAFSVSGITDMQAVDESTLRISMQLTGVPSVYALSFPIVRRGSMDVDTEAAIENEAGAMNSLPIGTGPYMVSASGNASVTLTVNPDWWKQSPYIEKITFLERDNNETALASYAAGQLNMTPTSNVSVGKYREEGVTRVLDVMTQNAEMLLFNNSNADLRDIRVRQALVYAIDRSSIITNVYMNRAQACDVPIAPDSWLYESKSKKYDYNVEQAKTLLAEAGWVDIDEDGVLDKEGSIKTTLSLTLLVCEGAESVRKTAADLIASQLGDVGIVVEVVPAAYSLGSAESEFSRKLAAGEFDLALMGVSVSRNADVRDLVSINGAHNYGRSSDAALERLSQNILTAADESGYRSAASAFQLQFVEALPFAVLYFRLNSIVYSARIQGLSDVREPYIFQDVEKWYMYTDADRIQ